MMKHNKSESDVSPQPPRLVSRPQQYVEVNDLRTLLKLGLGLHTRGEPLKRMDVAINGLARLASADAWLASAISIKRSQRELVLLLNGGRNAQTARAAAARLESDCSRMNTPIGKAIAHRRATPGRVMAFIEKKNLSTGESAIHSVLRPEHAGETRITWISIHRSAKAPPFEERERRIVELFHSQSAWLLLQMAK
jgi:hypothetical protein